jgi:hypothetical protein
VGPFYRRINSVIGRGDSKEPHCALLPTIECLEGGLEPSISSSTLEARPWRARSSFSTVSGSSMTLQTSSQARGSRTETRMLLASHCLGRFARGLVYVVMSL